jgi:hypothetical protein
MVEPDLQLDVGLTRHDLISHISHLLVRKDAIYWEALWAPTSSDNDNLRYMT